MNSLTAFIAGVIVGVVAMGAAAEFKSKTIETKPASVRIWTVDSAPEATIVSVDSVEYLVTPSGVCPLVRTQTVKIVPR